MRHPLASLFPTGLRWRLAAWVALVVLICTGITFVAVYRGTGSQLRHQIDREIEGDAAEFAHNLAISTAQSPAQVAQAARSYVSKQPFGASSTLLFAIVPGAGLAANRPGLLTSSKPDNGETPAEQAAENRLAAKALRAGDGFHTLPLPDVGNLRVLKREFSTPGGLRVTIGVGEPLAAVSRAQSGVARAFVLAAILALIGALLGAYAIGTRVSRPLRRMAEVAARVDAGDLHPRIHDPGGQSEEVRVLTDAFNHMLDRLTAAFASQRAFVADASHELRTPLTVIRGQLEVLAAQPNPSGAELRRVERLVQAELARITRLVDDLLLLAKAEQTQFLRTEPIALGRFVHELWDGASLIAARHFELGPVPEGVLRADPDRLAQALRNLIANAVKHTTPGDGLVRLLVEPAGPGSVRFTVEDDGPGIPLGQREQVFDRFHRTDAARDRASGGAGLGLAIVRAISVAHGGRVGAGDSPEGGARIVIELPGFDPAPPPVPDRGSAAAVGPVQADGFTVASPRAAARADPVGVDVEDVEVTHAQPLGVDAAGAVGSMEAADVEAADVEAAGADAAAATGKQHA
jgi:two-component system, OmpR family, sensor kinase